MTTDAATPQVEDGPLQPETTGAETQVSSDTPPEQATDTQEPTVDLKAVVAERDATIAKLENDARSIQGRRGKQDGFEKTIDELRAEIKTSGLAQTAMMRALASGETEALASSADAMEREQAARTYSARTDSFITDIDQTVRETGIDRDSPEMRAVTDRWDASYGLEKEGGLGAVHAEQARITAEVSMLGIATLKKTQADALKASEQREQEAGKQALEKADAMDMDTGPTRSAPAARSRADAARLYNEGKIDGTEYMASKSR